MLIPSTLFVYQLDTPQKTYHLVADSIKECEEWLKGGRVEGKGGRVEGKVGCGG